MWSDLAVVDEPSTDSTIIVEWFGSRFLHQKMKTIMNFGLISSSYQSYRLSIQNMSSYWIPFCYVLTVPSMGKLWIFFFFSYATLFSPSSTLFIWCHFWPVIHLLQHFKSMNLIIIILYIYILFLCTSYQISSYGVWNIYIYFKLVVFCSMVS